MTAEEYDDMARAVLAAVAACPHRGSVLPVGRQPECGCAELTECRAGKGRRAGEVTRAECMECAGRGIDTTRPGEAQG